MRSLRFGSETGLNALELEAALILAGRALRTLSPQPPNAQTGSRPLEEALKQPLFGNEPLFIRVLFPDSANSTT